MLKKINCISSALALSNIFLYVFVTLFDSLFVCSKLKIHSKTYVSNAITMNNVKMSNV